MKKNITAFAIAAALLVFHPILRAQWVQTTFSSGTAYVNAIASANGVLYAGTEGKGMYVSPDGGATWNAANNGLAANSTTADIIYALLVSGNTVYAGTNVGIFTTTDNGADWTSIGEAYQDASSLVIANGILYQGTQAAGIYVTTNNGAQWTQTFPGTPYNNIVHCLFASGNIVYAGTDEGVFSTTDTGSSWIAMNTGLTLQAVLAIGSAGGNLLAFESGDGLFISSNNGYGWSSAAYGTLPSYVFAFAASGNKLFAGSNDGVFASGDNGFAWDSVNDGFNKLVEVKGFAVMDSVLYAGGSYVTNAYYGVVYKQPLNQITVGVNQGWSDAPLGFSLSQNYPNPFSGTTNVEYRIPNEEPVTLKVFNALGEEVATLVNGEQSAGTHSAAFNASGLQNGMYFYRLTAGMFSQSGKMAVTR